MIPVVAALTWREIIPLIAKHGIPWAFEMWKVFTKYPTPTDEAWNELLALSQKSMAEYIAEAKK